MRSFLRGAAPALRLVWLAVTLAILLVLAVSFAAGRDRILGWIPACEWKTRYGRECAFCGMTTSFLSISDGRFADAARANRGGLPLYLAFVSNELFALAFLRRKGTPRCKP